MSFKREDRVPVEENDSTAGDSADEKEVCRDFKNGKCTRGEKCIFSHLKLDVCRDFQYNKCTRQSCKFLHITREEEDVYTNSGALPFHINNSGQAVTNSGVNGIQAGVLGKRNFDTMSGLSSLPASFLQKNSTMPISYVQPKSLPLPYHGLTTSYNPQNSTSPALCRDFEKGQCTRGVTCRYYHPRLLICRDFQKQKCEREKCKFLHMSREEEETYDNSGVVPDHMDKEEVLKKRLMNSPSVASVASTLGATSIGDMYGNKGQHDVLAGVSQTAFATIVQENVALKLKISEMQMQITDLRKMNDTLYEQNINCRKYHKST